MNTDPTTIAAQVKDCQFCINNIIVHSLILYIYRLNIWLITRAHLPSNEIIRRHQKKQILSNTTKVSKMIKI
ncbi:hypothetical protein [Dulcicalothrix desertica]|uniref:hypothetical protein n=1 Tax=Dulcicalothrix desertica TaxID=32056 RepID=UPI00119DE035|nr:hypothetical protein [Dulcicalothrix desertica]